MPYAPRPDPTRMYSSQPGTAIDGTGNGLSLQTRMSVSAYDLKQDRDDEAGWEQDTSIPSIPSGPVKDAEFDPSTGCRCSEISIAPIVISAPVASLAGHPVAASIRVYRAAFYPALRPDPP